MSEVPCAGGRGAPRKNGGGVTYRITRISQKGRPLTRAVYLGTVEATSEVDAIRKFMEIQSYYRDAVELAASPAQKAA
jgi:hypothetical protein